MQTSETCGGNLHALSLVTWAAVTWNVKQSNLECRYGIPLGVSRGRYSTVATRIFWIQMWIASEHLNHNLQKENRRWIRNGVKVRPALIHSSTTSAPFTPQGDIVFWALRICVAKISWIWNEILGIYVNYLLVFIRKTAWESTSHMGQPSVTNARKTVRQYLYSLTSNMEHGLSLLNIIIITFQTFSSSVLLSYFYYTIGCNH